MKDNQISVFVANRPGELARLTQHLARFNVNIKAVSVSEAIDYAVVRMITNNIDLAGAALCEMGYGFVTTEVLAAEIPDRPGALSELAQQLADNDINIRYLYATVTPGGGVAMAILSTDDNDKAERVIGGAEL
jgi:hypothetical protein